MANAKNLTLETVYDASKSELLDFADQKCGIEFTGEENRDWIVSQICEAQGWVERDPSADATHAVIRLGKEMKPGGTDAYRGGFNGRMFSIPREMDVEVPIGYLNTITDSHRRGFSLRQLTKFKEGSPANDRIERSGVPVTVIKYLKKG